MKRINYWNLLRLVYTIKKFKCDQYNGLNQRLDIYIKCIPLTNSKTKIEHYRMILQKNKIS
jgi:hypothetical protein